MSKEDVGEGGRQVGEAGQGGHRRGEGPQEGLLPGARVCLWVVSISRRADGQWHLEGLSPLPGGRLGSWRRPPPSRRPRRTHPFTLTFPPALPTLCLTRGCPGMDRLLPRLKLRGRDTSAAHHGGCKARTESSGAAVGVIQRGDGKYHFISCLPPHFSGPFQASVHGVSMLLSNWVQKNGAKSR